MRLKIRQLKSELKESKIPQKITMGKKTQKIPLKNGAKKLWNILYKKSPEILFILLIKSNWNLFIKKELNSFIFWLMLRQL